MSPDRTPQHPADEPENGVLADTAILDTADLTLLSTGTAHVAVTMPLAAEEPDDDVVDDDEGLSAFDALLHGAASDASAPDETPSSDEPASSDEATHDEETPDEEATHDEAPDEEAAVVEPEADTDAEADEDDVVALDGDEAAADGDASDAAEPEATESDADEVDADEVETEADEADDADIEADEAVIEAAEAEIEADEAGEAETEADEVDEAVIEADDAASEADQADADADEADEIGAESESDEARGDAAIAAEPAEPAAQTPAVPETEGTEVSETPAAAAAAVTAPRRHGDIDAKTAQETPDLLTADRLLDPHRQARPEPEGAWSYFVYTISGKRINLGDSRRARERKALTARIAAPLRGTHSRFVPVLSRKGGVGKTTVTTLIGMAMADARDDRVVAVDANPDRGTLADRIARSSSQNVRDLVRVREQIGGYNDLSALVARDETRLDVLASDTDPRVAEAFGDADYRHVADVAGRFYSVILTDTGTGIVHSVMTATLDLADQLVIVAGPSIDESRLASETLTWLETNGFEQLARGAVVVLNQASASAPVVRLDEVEAHFRTRVRDVVRLPYDPQLAAGGAITFRELQPETRTAARELAALVVEHLRDTGESH